MAPRSNVTLVLLLLVTCRVVSAQSFQSELGNLIDSYKNDSTFTIFESVYEGERLTRSYPNEWLAPYWTAFFYTQLGLYTGRDERLDPYLELSQIYLEKATSLADSSGLTSNELRADLIVLQAFISSWKSRTSSGRFIAREQDALRQHYLAAAKNLDPDNPMVAMMEGLPLLRQEQTRVQGEEICRRAIQLYLLRAGTKKPTWGESFIPIWFQRFGIDPSG